VFDLENPVAIVERFCEAGKPHRGTQTWQGHLHSLPPRSDPSSSRADSPGAIFESAVFFAFTSYAREHLI
jgi:hypothetical protein